VTAPGTSLATITSCMRAGMESRLAAVWRVRKKGGEKLWLRNGEKTNSHVVDSQRMAYPTAFPWRDQGFSMIMMVALLLKGEVVGDTRGLPSNILLRMLQRSFNSLMGFPLNASRTSPQK